MTVAQAVIQIRKAKMIARAAIILTRGGEGAARGALTTSVVTAMTALDNQLTSLADAQLAQAQAKLSFLGVAEPKTRRAVEGQIREAQRLFSDLMDLFTEISDLSGIL